MVKTGLYAEIIVDLAVRKTDHVFHYAVPQEFEDVLQIGSRVLVPFRERQLAGYVVGFGLPESQVHIREIAGILDEEPVFSLELLELARWMSESYLCSTAEALQRIISPRLQVKSGREVRRIIPALAGEELEQIVASMSRAPRQAAVLRAAMASPGLSVKELAATAETTSKTVKLLVDKGYLAAVKKTASQDTSGYDGPQFAAGYGALQLNADQTTALEQIEAALKNGKFNTFLLHGVTGSGKTEVYLRAIAAALQEGRQAVALVPEIALTPQMIELFQARFGSLVAVLHSGLAGTARYQAWRRVKSGEAPVVLGTRSAVFAPMPRPGLFIIDEEHESTYKQDDHLRYHAREVALKRAQQSGSVVILGSATPSLESYLRAGKGGLYHLLELPARIGNHPLPPVQVVDMREEIRRGNRGIFSLSLIEAISRRLERHEQVILFLNRRGYANFVVCRECGLVLKCPSCDISLTYHLDGRLRCHYCNYSITLPTLCPKCSSKNIRHFGVGTQKVEEEARRLFPQAKILRMDSDTTSRRGSHERIINSFRDGHTDILIGTQMIAKGLDLPKVTLVGVINADTTLHMPDFRAAERTFQLLTQVAGRAGRGSLAGEVQVQTYTPEHYSIIAAAAHDYESFYRSEAPVRRALGYPPFNHLARLLLTYADEEILTKGALLAKELLEKIVTSCNHPIEVLGPAPAPLSRIKGQFRWQLVLKGPHRNTLKDVLKESLIILDKERPAFKPSVHVDINPQGMS
ncbi:MAG: primosomal protein N' [Desulfotomaculaceae bacterium]|nr:primosomal protein N' [Desulfotomaculaceae bacterium]